MKSVAVIDVRIRTPINTALFMLLLLPLAAAQSGNITLLTVSEDGDTLKGGTAELFLDVKPGTGTIFIDSFPLTKLDTQISTRFANQVACQLIQEDCSRYDFFYTIKADSALVGGPSAGAATALLTIAVLKHLQLNTSMTMTGTINSGGLIGPVAGIPEKVDAAKNAGFTSIIVPQWTDEPLPDGAYQVTTIQEAVLAFTGEDISLPAHVSVSTAYEQTMQSIARDICARYSTFALPPPLLTPFSQQLIAGYVGDEDTIWAGHSSVLLYLRGQRAFGQGEYYSAASYCFGANQRAREYLLAQSSAQDLQERHAALLQNISLLEMETNSKPIETIADLEAFIIVRERILEARNNLEVVSPYSVARNSARIARAEERLFSAQMWMRFFGSGKTEYQLDEAGLRQACIQKIAEAEERLQYAALYFPQLTRDDLLQARQYYQSGESALCVFQASKTKAETELLLTSLFIATNDTEKLLHENLYLAQQVLAREQQKGLFPILGYSYYAYARDLEQSDPLSGLLYANYAMELSNLDSYFPKKTPFLLGREVLLVGEGILIGVVLSLLVMLLIKKPRKIPRKGESSWEKR